MLNNCSQTLIQRWFDRLADRKQTSLMAPYAYVFASVEQAVLESCRDIISQHCHEGFLPECIIGLLAPSIKAITNRVTIVELHSAKKNGFLTARSSRKRYFQFLEKLAEPENQNSLFAKYTELKALFVSRVEQTINVLREFLQHLGNDMPALQAEFLGPRPLKLDSIKASGDSHQQGHQVCVLTFTASKGAKRLKKLVYKPRSLAIDVAFNAFVNWVNHQSKIQLKTYRVLNQGSYGWCEFVQHNACRDLKAVKRFYRRAGMLMAVLYLLGTTDMHHENIIAHGEFPIIVDLETTLKPEWDPRGTTTDTDYHPTLLEMLMLPTRVGISDESVGTEISALACKGGETYSQKGHHYDNPETDKLKLSRRKFKVQASQNRPFIRSGQSIDNIAQYEPHILKGFTDTYRLLIEKRDVLLSDDSPLSVFKNSKLRLVLRATSDYSKLLYESYHPLLLAKAEDRQKHLNWLEEIVEYLPHFKSVISHELHDLQECNIPIFYQQVDADQITCSRGSTITLNGYVSGWQSLQRHLTHLLNNRNLVLQQAIIRGAFSAYRMNENVRVTAKKPRRKTIQTVKDWRLQSKQIGQRLTSDVLKLAFSRHNQPIWPNISILGEDVWQLRPTEMSLYDGSGGVLLALAYADYFAGWCDAKSLAMQFYQAVKTELAQSGHKALPLSAFGTVGAYSGLGGLLIVLYRLMAIGFVPNDIKLFEALIQKAQAQIAEDESFDVIGGCAGLLMALQQVHSVVSPELYDSACRMAVDHLLKYYPDPTMPPQPLDEEKTPRFAASLLGFSHGTSGVATSLSAFRALDKRIDPWVEKALQYENQFYDAEQNNWPDFRENVPKERIFASQWCHGAAGMVLSRLSLLARYPQWRETLYRDLQRATQNTLDTTERLGTISLCHGWLGNIDILMEVAREYPELVSQAQIAALRARCVNNIIENPTRLQGGDANIGLMTGVSGVIYQAIRLLKPELVPSILYFDTITIPGRLTENAVASAIEFIGN